MRFPSGAVLNCWGGGAAWTASSGKANHGLATIVNLFYNGNNGYYRKSLHHSTLQKNQENLGPPLDARGMYGHQPDTSSTSRPTHIIRQWDKRSWKRGDHHAHFTQQIRPTSKFWTIQCRHNETRNPPLRVPRPIPVVFRVYTAYCIRRLPYRGLPK